MRGGYGVSYAPNNTGWYDGPYTLESGTKSGVGQLTAGYWVYDAAWKTRFGDDIPLFRAA